MTRLVSCSILLLYCVFLFPIILSMTLYQKASMLEPVAYNLRFYFTVNMSELQFNYVAENQVLFKLNSMALDQLVLRTSVIRVIPVKVVQVIDKQEHLLSTHVHRYPSYSFYAISKTDNSTFQPGLYKVVVVVNGPIPSSHGQGIRHSIFMDSMKKDWTYSIWLDFIPGYAQRVLLIVQDVNTVCSINIQLLTLPSYHAFFVRESQLISNVHGLTKTKMHEMMMPLGFLVLYLTQNVRITQGSQQFSATVTTGRNQQGAFTDQYRYVLPLLYRYVEHFSTFGPLKMPLKYPDVFVHLYQNMSSEVVTLHSSCVISMPYLAKFYQNLASLHSFLARCLAANHIMTRRYPVYWNSYYIQVGLLEYYAIFMQLNRGGSSAKQDFSGLGAQMVTAFNMDDFGISPVLGTNYSNPVWYYYLNAKRCLCFVNMLKHLIVTDKSSTFNMIVSQFLADEKVLYNRSHFIQAYQNVTENKVFSNAVDINLFFDGWTLQGGYPIVKVTRSGNFLNFSQDKLPWFRDSQPFMIPINIVIEPNAQKDINKTHPDFWLTSQDDTRSYPIPGLSKWYVVNNQRTGYYRVFYDSMNYKFLRFELVRGSMRKISAVTRGQILDDAMFLATCGVVSYKTALELLEYLKHETEELPWMIASHELKSLDYKLRFTPAYTLFQNFMLKVSRKFYRRRVEDAVQISPEALHWACFGGLQHCLEYTNKLFKAFLQKRTSFEHLDKIICEGVRLADDDTFLYIKLSLNNEYRGMEQDLYVTALVCSKGYNYQTEALNILMRRTSLVASWITPTEKSRHVKKMCETTQMGALAVLDFLFTHPTLVLANLGESELISVLQRLAMSLYKRGHERKVRLIVMYLGLKDTKDIYRQILGKRMWCNKNYLVVSKVLGHFDEIGDDE